MARRESPAISVCRMIAWSGARSSREDDPHRLADVGERDAETHGQVRLRVHVDAEHPVSQLGQCAAEVDRGRRLPDATLLVRNGNYLGQRNTYVGCGWEERRATAVPPMIRAATLVGPWKLSTSPPAEPLSLCKDERLYSELSTSIDGPIAQWSEHPAHNRLVAGSIPAGPTTHRRGDPCRRRTSMRACEGLRARRSWAEASARIEQQHARGKLTARERWTCSSTRGTFAELDAFVTHRATDFGIDEQRYLGDGVVTGYGRIDGRARLRLRAGLHRLRWLAVGGARREDLQGDGSGDGERRADHRPVGLRRRAHPGRGASAWAAMPISSCATRWPAGSCRRSR